MHEERRDARQWTSQLALRSQGLAKLRCVDYSLRFLALAYYSRGSVHSMIARISRTCQAIVAILRTLLEYFFIYYVDRYNIYLHKFFDIVSTRGSILYEDWELVLKNRSCCCCCCFGAVADKLPDTGRHTYLHFLDAHSIIHFFISR